AAWGERRMRVKKQTEAPTGASRRATLMDVVRASGTSKATVSRVLNNRPGVIPDLRDRVLAAIQHLNYTPIAAARALSRSRSNTIGVVFQDITSGWLLNVFRGVMHVASATGYSVLTTLSTRPGDESELPRKLLAEERIDGLVWCDPRITPEMVQGMKDLNLPFVVIQKHVNDPEVNTVGMENYQSAYLAMKHLLDLGYRRLLLVTGSPDNEDSNQRLQGARQALSECHIRPATVPVVVGHHVGMLAVKALAAHLEEGRRMPEAIFAFNDSMAIAIIQWLRARCHRVPDDVAVVGFDGTDEAEQVGLTTVETPMYESGVLATQILLDCATTSSSKDKKIRQVMLRGNLRIRESCGAKLKGAEGRK
ncbi:MAG TPA: LacI family DNA-binding transcriptional regulator, partial [Kiritimatiellia bacterium]